MANPFEDDMDEPVNRGGGGSNFRPVTKTQQPTMQDEWSYYEQQIETTMQNTLDSTKRSMMMLEESEAVGIKTAEQLAEQGEKLTNAERRMDEIDATTTQTQRNLNNIKSVFGGVKNYFSRKPSAAKSKAETETKLNSTVDRLKNSNSDTTGFYDSSAAASSQGKGAKGKTSVPSGPSHTLNENSRSAIQGTRWEHMDNEIDENLGMMSNNLARLRDLGVALGEETEQQNKQLERMQPKADKVDTKIRDQNKQMGKLLGHKDQPATVKKNDDGGESSSAASRWTSSNTSTSFTKKFW